MSQPLPDAFKEVRQLDPSLADRLAEPFQQLTRVTEAMAWATAQLDALVGSGGPDGALRIVVNVAADLTQAPVVWAVRWKSRPGGALSVRGLACAGDPQAVPGPEELSSSVLQQVADTGRAAWSDDAAADARFASSHSVMRLKLRSVGCVPLGGSAALYLADPNSAGRFSMQQRARLTALGRVAEAFVRPDSRVTAATLDRPVEEVPGLVGQTPAMGALYDAIRAFAPMPWPVLVLGETGAGKEGVARALHTLSPRSNKPFVAVNCATIPENLAESTLFGHERGAFTGADRAQAGLVERVGEGTLFLDEIGELAPAVQAKLLRLLQEGTYERLGARRTESFTGRVVAATLRNVDDPATRGTFREDLYYRLAACVVNVPPLRDRRRDIPVLSRHLLDRAVQEIPGCGRLALSEGALAELTSRPWPGNVRELENMLRGGVARALAAGERVIDRPHLSPSGSAPAEEDVIDGDLQAATLEFQRRRVEAALEASGGNRTKAAEALGVSRQWLHRLMSRWDIA